MAASTSVSNKTSLQSEVAFRVDVRAKTASPPPHLEGGKGIAVSRRIGFHLPENAATRGRLYADIRPCGLVVLAFLARRGRQRDVTIGTTRLGETTTILGRSIPPPRQWIRMPFSRGLGLAYALVVLIGGQSRGTDAEDEGYR